MPLQLEIISEHQELVGDDATREFGENGGTIGRSLENDWILPDPVKYISSRHAVIDYKGGIYYLVDISTNGVFVNDERDPIGKGNPRRLFNGDLLRMGDFEIRVAIDQGESIAMPLEGARTDYPEPIEQAVPEYNFSSSMQLLDESELTEDSAFAAAFELAPAATQRSSVDTDPKNADYSDIFEDLAAHVEARMDAPKESKPAADKAADIEFSSDDLFDAFLDGIGVSRADLHKDVDPARVMQNAGEVLKEFIEGSSRLLASRAHLKATFRLDQTTILPRHNNPLKLAENTADSIMQMLIGEEGEYLGPRDAVREVCRDLLYHQDAFLEGMSSAFEEFADRFDPAELTASFDRHLDSKPLLGFLDKLKYWQLYCDVYPVITDKDTGRFPQAVAEEFVAAYERRIADYKRLDVDGSYEPLAATQPIRIRDLERGEPVNDEFDADSGDIDTDEMFDNDAAARQA